MPSIAAASWERVSPSSTRSPAYSRTSCVPGIGPSPGTVISTRPLRVRADGLTATGRVAADTASEGGDGAVGEALRDLVRLGVAVHAPRR